jgi:septal ring-binding cell division protein DamX
MKKYLVLCAGLCLALSFTSCKSSDKAYRQAYDKAKQQSAIQDPYETPVVQQVQTVTPVQTQTQPVTQTQVVDNYDNVSVRRESVTLVSGNGLQDYSVVVGSMTVFANAEGLQQRLKNGGYGNAQIVKAIVNGTTWYRVIASTFATKAEAARSRDAILGTEFNRDRDAWLLYNVK